MKRIEYRITRPNLIPGQVIRSRQGVPVVITAAEWQGERGDRVLAVTLDDDTTMHMTNGRPFLRTWLSPDLADQPGLDASTGRCATCDSRICPQVRCMNPWVADVLLSDL